MKKYILLIACLLAISKVAATVFDLNNTDANIIGHVIDRNTGEHLPYVSIALKGTVVGTVTDKTGHFFLKNLPEGKVVVTAEFMGYEPMEKEVVLTKGVTIEVNFELKESTLVLDEVTVSADRNKNLKRLTPNLMSVLDIKTFDQTNSCTVADGLNFRPGLRVENNCQNCGFSQVRMNGLEGAYSRILIDSRPVFGSLAGVYGLEQLPANMIERIEVVRGAGSVLSGASAIAGTINIITKEPIVNSAGLTYSGMSIGGKNDFDNNVGLNASLVSDNQKAGIMIFGQKRYRSGYDHDGDGFTEIPHLNSGTLGFRSFVGTSLHSKITLEYHSIREFRRGGDNLSVSPQQAYIAEQIESDIDGGSIQYDLYAPDEKYRFSVYSAGMLTDRKSYYGGGEPAGELTGNETPEEILNYNDRMNAYGKTKNLMFSLGSRYTRNFDDLFFMPAELTFGAEYLYDDLDDKSGYRTESIEQQVNMTSAFAQNEWRNGRWSFLIGGRLDKHSLLNNAVFSPCVNLRYDPTSRINFRLGYGQGFRAPQLYDEDLHVDIAGGEQIVSRRDPNLKEEKSYSITGSADSYFRLGGMELNFSGEVFYTVLKNPFTVISEDSDDGSVIKTIVNASGAKVYGINLEGRAGLGADVQVQTGLTLQRSLYDESRKWSDDEEDDVKAERKMMRTPDVYGYFILTLKPVKQLTSSFSGVYTGSMSVPHEAGYIEKNKTERTSSFFDLNWKVSYTMLFYKSCIVEINGGIQNIFDAFQKDFDKGPNRASAYVYGPSLPRSFYAGAKISF